MIKCKECGSLEYDGSLFCGQCGRSLLGASSHTTSQLPFSETPAKPNPPALVGQKLGHSADVKKITFVIPTSGRRLTLTLEEEIRIGRTDSENELFPSLDLTDDNGLEHGVSRNHACVRNSNKGVVLIDSGSTNGTYLNNYHIPPDLPYPLQTGDEVRLGQLLVHVFIE